MASGGHCENNPQVSGNLAARARPAQRTLASQVFGPGGANTIPVLVVVKVGLVVTLRT